MYTRSLDRLFRIFLIVCLLAGLSITTAAAAAPSTAPVSQPQRVSADGATFPPITIPYSASIPTIDGDCTVNEYGSAAGYSFTDTGGGTATVNLMHDGT